MKLLDGYFPMRRTESKGELNAGKLSEIVRQGRHPDPAFYWPVEVFGGKVLRMPPRVTIFILALLLAYRALPATVTQNELERSFSDTLHPFLDTYCFGCHGKEKQKGKLDLSPYSSIAAVANDYRRWEIVLEKLKAGEMPPEEARHQPAPELRRKVIDWIQALRRYEAHRRAGDPGPVLARRLSNAEYDYTIRDLTGVDMRPTREFPVDPANEAGFDNSGESLLMSPALLNKYLQAARHVAEYMVLLPHGFKFAPYPVVTDTDRDKYCVKRIIDFYQRQPTNYTDYFMAAWRFEHRAGLGHREWALADVAAASQLSPKYLSILWSTLAGTDDEVGPIAALRSMWRELPAWEPNQSEAIQRGCERMRDFVTGLRGKLKTEFSNLAIRGIAPGSQPFVLWKDRQYAANRMRCNHAALRIKGEPDPQEELAPGPGIDPALVIPSEAERARYEAAFDRFCRIFPDAFYVAERGLIFLKEDKESRGRLLSAGFHLMVGYFRDDAPLTELVLDEKQRHELDALWEEFHFITLDRIRQYKDFIFFERAEPPRFMQAAEFDFARSEDKDATSEHKIRELAEAYLAKARRNGGAGIALEAIEDYFRTISDEIRWVEHARQAAESSHLETLQKFAERAYRRPLSHGEREDLLSFYRSLREKEGLNHGEALRDTVASVLISPDFCYLNLATGEDDGHGSSPFTLPIASNVAGGPSLSALTRTNVTAAAHKEPPVAVAAPSSDWNQSSVPIQQLSDYSLASRLSYFLWSSLPDEELLAHAARQDLREKEVLLAETRRMLQDDRIRALATEFGGNWLDFRRFEEHNAVDRERFKTFNNELRESMFQEPIHFLMDVIRENRSVLACLYGEYTFVNPPLAQHYGMVVPDTRSNQWVRIDDAERYGRGGLLPMAVFLTKNSPGLRTSPVKRGYWVVRRLLGEYIPPPPPKVPELPNDEAKLGELTLRETLVRHRADKSCSGCHEHFDSLGLVFEGYGPVGELRLADFAGRKVDTRATFPNGTEGTGLAGLREYLRQTREGDFLDNLCRKLLCYALGRTLLLSDDGTIEDMRAKLQANEYRFDVLVESIVTSPQFLHRRAEPNLTKQ